MNNNPTIDFLKSNNANSMFRMINQTDEFKLQKYTGTQLEDIMTVNEDGVVIFPKNVEFKGNSTIINTNVVTFQDQQVDLGLMSTVKLDVTLTIGTNPNPNTSSVSKTNPSANVFRYTFKLQDSNSTLQIPFAVNDYVLIQNIFSTANTPVLLFDSVALLVVAVDNSVSPKTFTIESSLNYEVLDIATSDNAIASKLIPITSNTNLGVRLLGHNSGSLVEGNLKFNNSSSNLSLENNTGAILVGSNSVNQNINIGTGGNRHIQVGSANAATVNLDANVFTIEGNNASNITTSSGVLTVGGAGGVVINSTSGVINLGNESVSGAINIGTAGGRTIQIGNNASTAINLDANSFSIDANNASNINTSSGVLTIGGVGGVAINSTSGEINIGNESVTGAINIGTSNTARIITIGATNTTSVTAYNFTVASDLMLKTNVTPLSSTLDKVLQLEGYKYNWKNSENNTTQIGLIAQEVEKQFPELVIQNTNFKSVNYLGMIAVLINAMKEQQQEIENIRNKLN